MITLATLHKATEQEVFDQAAIHLLKQNQKSVFGDMGCMYRGDNGLKCAAGCLISDEEYDISMETHLWGRLAANGQVPIFHNELIRSLQSIHDQEDPQYWRAALVSTADRFNLNTDAIRGIE